LGPIDKALILQALPIFSQAWAEELNELTTIVHEVPLDGECLVFSEGDPPSIWIPLDGELCLEPPQGGNTITVVAGDALGVAETLAGRAMGWRGRVAQQGKALKIDREDLFELLAHRTELLQGVFGALFRSAAQSTKGRS
jgi:hypothetical protein